MQIEKNVPIEKQGSGYTQVLRQLEIGDSFVVPAEHRNKFASLAKAIGIQITTHKTEDGKVRVWRTA